VTEIGAGQWKADAIFALRIPFFTDAKVLPGVCGQRSDEFQNVEILVKSLLEAGSTDSRTLPEKESRQQDVPAAR
jgi:hypothetical protein